MCPDPFPDPSILFAGPCSTSDPTNEFCGSKYLPFILAI
jgi:hypothetical protein